MRLSGRRINVGRAQVYIEPRDAWVGIYLVTLATRTGGTQ